MLKNTQILLKYDKVYAVAIPLDLPSDKPYNTVGLSCLVEAMCMVENNHECLLNGELS
jgi:hypothetical protein